MRASSLAGAILLSGAIAACGGALRPPTATPVTASGERDGVRVTLSLQRDRYAPGDEIWADVLIENTNDRAVFWTGGGCNIPARVSALLPTGDAGKSWPEPVSAWKVRLVDEDSQKVSFMPEAHWANFKRGEGMFCTADIRLVELDARSSLRTRAGWDGTMPFEHRVRAPDGRYDIEAVFPLGHWDTPRPISVSVPVELTGGGAAPFISRGQALDSALSHAGFRAWLEERLAKETREMPVTASLLMEDGEWRLRVGQKLPGPGGVDGYEADVRIDARTAQLLQVDFARRP
jgi:hypothetical protein